MMNYRKNVGMVILNQNDEIFAARRINTPKYLQMPQGGIDEYEKPEEAVYREMEEEIGTKNVELLQICEQWIQYEVPSTYRPEHWQGKYIGQNQKWFMFRFLGADNEINIHLEHAEFSSWLWATPQFLYENVIEFRKECYKKILTQFNLLRI